MTHFTDIELQRWRDAGPGEERPRVIDHLAVCSQCAGRYAAVIRRRPLREEAANDVAEFVAAGRRVGGQRVAFRRRWVLSIAAAAVLLLVIAFPVEWHRHDTIPDLHFRGGDVVALAPQGTSVDRSNLELVWSSAIVAPRYRIELGQSSRIIYTAEVSANRLALPSAVRDSLQPGVEYWWTVTALDSAGKALTRSVPTTFVIGTR